MAEARISTPVPTQPPIQWVLGLSQGYSDRIVALTTHPPSRAEVKESVKLYIYSTSGLEDLSFESQLKQDVSLFQNVQFGPWALIMGYWSSSVA